MLSFLTLLRSADPHPGSAAPCDRVVAAVTAREAAVSAALAVHSQNRAASRHLSVAERRAARRAFSTACMAAIDKAHAAYQAAVSPSVREREAAAAWLTLGGSICRRAREIGAEVQP